MSELINNREYRIETLKHIIQHLHSGQAPDSVRTQLAELVRQTDASEIAAMEQALIAEGMSVQEVQSMCDMHASVVRDILSEPPSRGIAPGHPVDTFKRENEALGEAVGAARSAIGAILALAPEADASASLFSLRSVLNDLMDIEKHYARKENLVFSVLERHGIAGPSKVMWGKDDEVRALLRNAQSALQQPETAAVHWQQVLPYGVMPALDAVEEMIYKEENILLPMSRNTLTDDEWADIWLASPRYGWCLVEPRDGYRPPERLVKQGLKLSGGEDVELPTGTLALKQMIAMFNTLPVDITFVDADDRVAFFSEGPDRVFARSRAIIGRKVQHCHPPKSVDTVERIVGDFRAGRQDVAEFWIQLHGKFVHIRYFALRSEEGEYLGTLELTQDLTRLRALEGERRLLEYDTPAKGENA